MSTIFGSPYVVIGPDELAEPLGETIDCARCGETHIVEFSEPGIVTEPDGSQHEGEPGLLQFVHCDGEAYLVGVAGQRWAR